jgi:uncharacterized membrane protein
MTFTPDSIEGTTIAVVRWVKLGVEVFGAGLVTLGVCVAIAQLIRTLAARKLAEFTTTRLILARYLSLALEFELGADILGTAISPSWDQIGGRLDPGTRSRIAPRHRRHAGLSDPAVCGDCRKLKA